MHNLFFAVALGAVLCLTGSAQAQGRGVGKAVSQAARSGLPGPALAQYVHQQQALRGIGGGAGVPGGALPGPGMPAAGGPGKAGKHGGGPPGKAGKHGVGGPAMGKPAVGGPPAGDMKVKVRRVF